MTLSEDHLLAISRAVQGAGGDMADAEDLAAVWERMERTWAPRVDRMRREAAAVRCCCPRDPHDLTGGRCSRCQGWPR